MRARTEVLAPMMAPLFPDFVEAFEMKRFVYSTLVALMAGAMPAAAQGTSLLKIGIQGGWVTPYSTAKTYAKTGWDGGLTLQIAAPLVPVGFRFDVLYGSVDGKPQTVGVGTLTPKFTIYSGTANVVWTIFGTGLPTKLYLIGGIGYYSVSEKFTSPTLGPQPTLTRTNFGYNAGLGVKFTKLFIEARWTNINGGLDLSAFGSSSNKSLQIVPINIGLIF